MHSSHSNNNDEKLFIYQNGLVELFLQLISVKRFATDIFMHIEQDVENLQGKCTLINGKIDRLNQIVQTLPDSAKMKIESSLSLYTDVRRHFRQYGDVFEGPFPSRHQIRAYQILYGRPSNFHAISTQTNCKDRSILPMSPHKALGSLSITEQQSPGNVVPIDVSGRPFKNLNLTHSKLQVADESEKNGSHRESLPNNEWKKSSLTRTTYDTGLEPNGRTTYLKRSFSLRKVPSNIKNPVKQLKSVNCGEFRHKLSLPLSTSSNAKKEKSNKVFGLSSMFSIMANAWTDIAYHRSMNTDGKCTAYVCYVDVYSEPDYRKAPWKGYYRQGYRIDSPIPLTINETTDYPNAPASHSSSPSDPLISDQSNADDLTYFCDWDSGFDQRKNMKISNDSSEDSGTEDLHESKAIRRPRIISVHSNTLPRQRQQNFNLENELDWWIRRKFRQELERKTGRRSTSNTVYSQNKAVRFHD